MSELKFDKKVFNSGYAFVYSIMQCVFLIGFLFIVIVLCLPANTFTIPDGVLPLACGYLIASIAGFPIITLLKRERRKLVIGGKVAFNRESFIYDRLADKSWTLVGDVEEHHIYKIEKIDSIKKTRFFYVISGNIEKIVINNGRQLEKKNVSEVRVPNAYADMERMMNHG